MGPRPLVWGVNLLLVGLIAWAALAVVRGVMTPLARVAPRVVALPALAPERPAVNLDALLAAHLFGQAPSATEDEVVVEDAVADSSLHLLGVLHDARPERSRALIAIDGTQPAEGSNYRPGQELRPGLVLEEVLPNAALLRSGGRRFRLQLDQGALSGAGETAPLPEAVPDAEGAELPVNLRALRAAVRRDTAQASKYFRYEAAGKDGPREGYYLYPGSEADAFAAANLQPGDLLVSVNGIPATAANAASVAAALQFSPRVSLELLRAGQPLSLNFDLE